MLDQQNDQPLRIFRRLRTIMTNVQVYIKYLLHRFQLIPLSLLVLSDVLVIARITAQQDSENFQEDFERLLAVFALVILYLFNNRVGDDKRDFDFDNLYHPERAVQKGLIGLKQLAILGYLTMAFMVIFAALLGMYALILMPIVLCFAWWAKRDFFLPSAFKQEHFFAYNFINMLQMLVLQTFIYLSLMQTLRLTSLMWLHIAFVFVLSLQVEVTRKIKTEPTNGNDQYSDRMGMNGSLTLWFILGVLAVILFSAVAHFFQIEPSIITAAALLSLTIMATGAIFYSRVNRQIGESIFWLAMIVAYVGQNCVLAYG